MKSRILVLGCGVSGRAAAKLALSLGMETFIADEGDSPKLQSAAKELAAAGAKAILGWSPEIAPLPDAGLVVASPGLTPGSKLLQAVLSKGLPVIGELEFGFRSLPCPIVAITGTNGKTTTTELTTHLLKAAGLKAEAAGNIGTALSEAAVGAKGRGLDIMVVEVSSFQLERVDTFSPKAAAILNLASDHINRHGGMDEYARVKFKVFSKMKPSSAAMIVNANILDSWERHMGCGVKPVTFSAGLPADFLLDGDLLKFRGRGICRMSEAQLKGPHNAENILASLALVRAVLGDGALSDKSVLEALKSFKPDAHRLELFAEHNGVRYVNDSKATNPHSVNAALKTFGGCGNVILLLGGLDKDMDFSPLLDDASKMKKAFLLGQCREKIMDSISPRIDCEICGSFEEAALKACEAASPGDVVMLSPACASMDMFANYRERGDAFKRIVLGFLDGSGKAP